MVRGLLGDRQVLLRDAAQPHAAHLASPLLPVARLLAAAHRDDEQRHHAARNHQLRGERPQDRPHALHARGARPAAQEGPSLRRSGAGHTQGGAGRQCAHRREDASRRLRAAHHDQRLLPAQAEAELPGLRHQRLRGLARELRVQSGLRLHRVGAGARRVQEHLVPHRVRVGHPLAAPDQHHQPHLLLPSRLQRHLLREERVRDPGGAQERAGRDRSRGDGALLPDVVLSVHSQAARGGESGVRVHAAARVALHTSHLLRAPPRGC